METSRAIDSRLSLKRLLYELFEGRVAGEPRNDETEPELKDRRRQMKIIAYDRMKPGVTYEKIEPYLPQEVANVWRLWKAGIVRENYARADELGVVIVFEVDSVETAKLYTNDFPLTKAGFLEWFFISLQVPLPIEVLFDSKVDTREPYDRTKAVPASKGAA